MTRSRLAGAGVALIALAGCGGRDGDAVRSPAEMPVAAPAASPSTEQWSQRATAADRTRLRNWRSAWIAALADARAGGAGDRIAADSALYAFDVALPDPMPPAGDYRCRTIKLGAKGAGGLRYIAYPFFACRVAAQGKVSALDKLTGSQRATGIVYPHDTTRAVFLGTMALGDEREAVRYGRDKTRDMAGWVERIGPARWRVSLPYPAFESTLDVLELVPVT